MDWIIDDVINELLVDWIIDVVVNELSMKWIVNEVNCQWSELSMLKNENNSEDSGEIFFKIKK